MVHCVSNFTVARVFTHKIRNFFYLFNLLLVAVDDGDDGMKKFIDHAYV